MHLGLADNWQIPVRRTVQKMRRDRHPVQRMRRWVIGFEHVDRHGVDARDRVPDGTLAQDIYEGLHLGKFRHRPSVPRRWPDRRKTDSY